MVKIKEHIIRNTSICIEGWSFMALKEIAKKPHIMEEPAPARKYLAREFTNYLLAIIEISTFTLLGKPNTATVSLAG